MAQTIDNRTNVSKLEVVLIAVDRLLARLNAEDRVSVVTINSGANVRLENAPGDDAEAVLSVLDDFEPAGGTDLVDGIEAGYEVLTRHRSSQRADRILLFTDALLGYFAQLDLNRFLDVMELFGNDNVGTTLFAVGSTFGDDVAYDISHVPGGNYYFLSDYERIQTLFDEEFDYLVTPVAYDVSVRITVPLAFNVAEVYGLPVDDRLDHSFELTVPTLFLSNREGGGAILMRLRAGSLVDFAVENIVADIDLAYTTPEGDRVLAPRVTVMLPSGVDPQAATPYFEDDAVKRATLLLNTALVLRHACEDVYQGYFYAYYTSDPNDLQRAINRLTEFLPYFDAMAQGLQDQTTETSRGLSEERALLEKLLATIQQLANPASLEG
jgi:Ca-activated chloride channel family protein